MTLIFRMKKKQACRRLLNRDDNEHSSSSSAESSKDEDDINKTLKTGDTKDKTKSRKKSKDKSVTVVTPMLRAELALLSFFVLCCQNPT